MNALSGMINPDIDALRQPQSWLSMNSTLHVANPESASVEAIGIDETSADILEGLLVREGYFQLSPLPWKLPLGDMATAIVRLAERGFVPPFCFVYDEFWLMFIKLNLLLRRLLGEGYYMLPNFWAWHIDPRVGQSGWKPHRDRDRSALFPDRRPKSLTVWLPLTDATTLNGCIYVLPAHLDGTYATSRDSALPGQQGSVFVWTQALLHWGSRSSSLASNPRISMSVEFQRGDVPTMCQPLIPPLSLLSQVLQYQHMHALSQELRSLASEVVSRTA
jgi:hypothetical protein